MSRTGGRVLRAGLLVAAVGAVVALDTGVVPLPYSSPGTSVPADQAAADRARTTAIRSTVAAMDAALKAGDPAAFVTGVDPADRATSDHLTRVAHNLQALPGADLGLSWDGSWSVDTGPDGADTSKAVAARLRLDVRLRDFDRAAQAETVSVRFRRTGTRWLVAGWDPLVGDGMAAWEAPADLAVERRPHVLVVGQKERATENARLADRAEEAVTRVGAAWPLESWNRRAVLVALTDQTFLDSWFDAGAAQQGGSQANFFDVLGTTGSTGTTTGNGERAVLATDFLLKDTRTTRVDLRYLVTLLAFQSFDSTGVPGWLYYGAADWSSYRPAGGPDVAAALKERGLYDATRTSLQGGSWSPRLTSSQDAFASGDRPSRQADWDSAFLTTVYIVQTFGEPKLRAFLVASSDTGEEKAMSSVLGLTRPALVKKVRAWAPGVGGGAA